MKLPPPQPDWPATWHHAAGFDGLEFGDDHSEIGYTLAYRRRFAITLELVRRAVNPPARILDVAAAQGNFSLALAEAGYAVTWNDLRGDLAEYVRLKFERGSIEYAAGNAFELQFPALFDLVLATEIIEHVAHPDRFLEQLSSLVRPGGYAVLTTPNGGYFRNRLPRFSDYPDPSEFESKQFGPDVGDHIFLLHEDELGTLAERAGWKVCDLRLHTSFFLNGHCKTEPLVRRIPTALVNAIDRGIQALPQPMRRRLDVGLAVLLQKAE